MLHPKNRLRRAVHVRTLPLARGAATALFVSSVFGCGAVGPEGERGAESAIVGGDKATADQFPGIVSLWRNGTHDCGGSVIAPGWILTAAHCVYSPGPTGGLSSVRTKALKQSGSDGEHERVFKVYKHPEYGPVAANADLALLRLIGTTDAPIVPLIHPADEGAYAPGTNLLVAGWGRTSSGGPLPDDLLFTNVTLRSATECVGTNPEAPFNDTMLCAGEVEGGRDACQGDSGGPLYAMIRGQKTQIATVSTGHGCAEPEKYGVYAKLSNQKSWIAQIMAEGDRVYAEQGACAERCVSAPDFCKVESRGCSVELDACLQACDSDVTPPMSEEPGEEIDAEAAEESASEGEEGEVSDADGDGSGGDLDESEDPEEEGAAAADAEELEAEWSDAAATDAEEPDAEEPDAEEPDAEEPDADTVPSDGAEEDEEAGDEQQEEEGTEEEEAGDEDADDNDEEE